MVLLFIFVTEIRSGSSLSNATLPSSNTILTHSFTQGESQTVQVAIDCVLAASGWCSLKSSG
jgi:hypothetical protein